jgi:hypothetical protein
VADCSGQTWWPFFAAGSVVGGCFEDSIEVVGLSFDGRLTVVAPELTGCELRVLAA